VKRSKEAREREVEEYLTSPMGVWRPGPEITNEQVGGGQGDRRFRDLWWKRAAITQCRPMKGERTSWEYRIAGYMTEDELAYAHELTNTEGTKARQAFFDFIADR
jgi:hypothetical protein